MANWQKKINEAAKITEIRIRELNPSSAKIIGDIAKHYHESRGSVLVDKMIQDWPGQQQLIAQTQQRNTELHKAIAVYHTRESIAKEVIRDMLDEIKTIRSTINTACGVTEQRLQRLLVQYTKRPTAQKKPIAKPKKRK